MDADLPRRFSALVESGSLESGLDEAVLLIAGHALIGLDIDRELARLDELAAGVRDPSIDAVRRHLVDGLGFVGDRSTYGDPSNSLLPKVLDRRCGIPLTLAIVAIEVGRRCGVPLLGIGMPGHFLLGSPDAPERFIDLFNQGAILDRDGCRAVFEGLHPSAPWDDAFLDPVSNLAMVQRVLANLANAYRRSGDPSALAWVMDLRLRLPGATERDGRELAMLLWAAGRYDAAAVVLEATGRERDQIVADRLRARLN